MHGVCGRGLGKAGLHQPPQLQKPQVGHGPHRIGGPGGQHCAGLSCHGAVEGDVLLGSGKPGHLLPGLLPPVYGADEREPGGVQLYPGAAAGRQPHPAGGAAPAGVLRPDEVRALYHDRAAGGGVDGPAGYPAVLPEQCCVGSAEPGHRIHRQDRILGLLCHDRDGGVSHGCHRGIDLPSGRF